VTAKDFVELTLSGNRVVLDFRLQYESLEGWMDFLTFLVQNLW